MPPSSPTSVSNGTAGAANEKDLENERLALMQQMSAAKPNWDIEIYLEVMGKATVMIEGWYRDRAQQHQDHNRLHVDHEFFQHAKISDIVASFHQDRPKLEHEVAALRAEKAEVIAGIKTDEEQHKHDIASDMVDFMVDQAVLQGEINSLQKDADEAREWVVLQGPPKRKKLQGLRDQLEQIAQDLALKVKLLQEAHEESKRIMRENLVLRLRAVRDAAAADAAAAGDGSAEDEASAALVGKPTTKTNERLTREVAVYVRESLALEHSLSHLQEQAESLSEELETKQSANEKLVLQNAASTKTKRILESKLGELQQQLNQVERDAEKRAVERSNSLVLTSQQQAQIIEGLNDEIDDEIEKLLSLKEELREAQEEKLALRRKSRAASRFFLSCGSDFSMQQHRKQQQQQSSNSGDGDPFAHGDDPFSTPVFSSSLKSSSSSSSTRADQNSNSNEEGDQDSNEKCTLFLPSHSALDNQQQQELPSSVAGLGKVTGRKEAAQLLMRVMQVDTF